MKERGDEMKKNQKKRVKRLELSKETVAMLGEGDLVTPAGGLSFGCGNSSNPRTDECCQYT
jgi:hypothetical protein